jgi:hypothetical protein
MQRFTKFFIIVNALHVLGGFSAHHQELKNCTHSIWYLPGLLVATASVASRWLYLKEYINDGRSHELQILENIQIIVMLLILEIRWLR